MQTRISVLACWKDQNSVRGRTDGDKGEFPSESEPNGTCSDQSHDSHDNTKGSLDRNPSNSMDHKPSQSNTAKPADLLGVLTQSGCYSSSLQKEKRSASTLSTPG
jgi:hypothetical protein